MGIVEFSLRRKVTISMCAAAVVLFGVVAFGRLPINLLPNLTYPSLTVETRYAGAAPAEVETLVSRPVEEAVGVVTGVRRLTSVSKPGLSQVTLEFGWGRNMDFAAIDVRQKLDMLQLPREVEKPTLLRFDPSNDPIMRLYVTGGKDLYQLRYVADEIIKKNIESAEGLAAVKVNGGYEEEIQIRVDQGKLALLGIPVSEVNTKLLQENVNQAGGSLYEEEARYLVRAKNEFENLDDIKETVVGVREGRKIILGDVAEVIRSHKKREVITRYGGKEAVELALYKEGDANTVTVARALRQRLEITKKELPEGLELVVGVDQSRFIQASIDEVRQNALMGGIIAVIVLLFFLKDIRSTLIIGLSIPISIVATFFMMYQTGTSLNIMSMGGLALGVGMLVDNAIVVLESIFKRRESGMSALESAKLGASEVGRAVIASTLTTIAVFLPVVFLEGIAAQLFLDMALTVSFSLVASLAVSLTIIPMLAAMLMGGSAIAARADEEAALAALGGGKLRRGLRFTFVRLASHGLRGLRILAGLLGKVIGVIAWPIIRIFDGILGSDGVMMKSYPVMLRWSLRARPMVLAIAFLTLAAAVLAVPRLGTDLIPSFSQGEFSFDIQLPEGTPLQVTDRFIADVQTVLEEDKRIETFSSISGGVGLSLARTGSEGENSGRIQVRMATGTSREDEEAVIVDLRERLEQSGLAEFKFSRPTYFSFRTPIEIEVYSDNINELMAASELVREAVSTVPGLVDVKSSAELGNPELQVTFNRDALVRLGLDVSRVAATMRNKVQGEVATRFLQNDREIDIMVRSVDVSRASVSDVEDMIVGQADGVPIFLKSVADIEMTEGPTEIRRIKQQRASIISGNLGNRDMGAVAADVREVLKRAALPVGVKVALSGQEEEMARSQQSLLLAMGLAIFLVYLVMASQFESFLHPFVIIFTLPLGAIGVVGALLITASSVSIVAMIGMVMLAGIVVNNAIVLIDAINQRRQEGTEKSEAIIAAGAGRLRPILMTTATTVLGLAPMAMGLGEGAELRAPLAITVIGGLAVGTAMTLLVIPVVYSILDRKVFAGDTAASARQAASAAAAAGGALKPDPRSVSLIPGSAGTVR
jgi:HAE1 family hydrophobic/amphiphilic exporter-1